MHANSFLTRTSHLLAAAVASAMLLSSLAAQTQFLGVAAGDTTSQSAIVWTRAVDPAAPAAVQLTLELSTDPTFQSLVRSQQVTTNANADYTAKLDLTGLVASMQYYYRFVAGGVVSEVGTYKTAPSPNIAAPVRFAFSGDCDGLMRPYPLASVFPTLNLDFFVFLGDTIYEAASSGSAAAVLTGTLPAPSATGATRAQLEADYARKYREQYLAVNAGGQECLKPMFRSQANYTVLDNHELGNRQYINGGAPAGGTVGGMPSGAGVDARQASNDVNTSGTFMNQAEGFQVLQQAFVDYQPIRELGSINAPTDPRTNGTRQLYYTQPWGRNAVFVNVDDRSYRDIRMKTAANADDTTSPRADNPARTMLGATQLAWLEQTLLDARDAGVVWKIVAISSPIDQLGPIGGQVSGLGDGGKSWMGGYRAERNALLRFIADNHIENVVFLSTDDHQNRVNEVLYSPSGQTDLQSSYVPVPRCFTIVCGPLGATGPDTISDHSFANIEAIANAAAAAQTSVGLDPIGLAPNYPGLHDVTRIGHATADQERTPIDFFSPDTFNFATMEISADGATLVTRITGIESRPTNSFGEYDPIGNPAHEILSFQIDAFTPCSAPVCGQWNTSCATLLVNGLGASAQGPIGLTIPTGGTVDFQWSGPENQPLVLAASPLLLPGQRLFGSAIVDLDLSTTNMLFGAFDPLWGSLFYTDAQGHARQMFSVPSALQGFTLNTQGVMFDLQGTCSPLGFMTTASFALQF